MALIETSVIDQNGNALTVLLSGVLTALTLNLQPPPPPPPPKPERFFFPGMEWQFWDRRWG